jgi:hypothetical protein
MLVGLDRAISRNSSPENEVRGNRNTAASYTNNVAPCKSSARQALLALSIVLLS